MGNAQVDEMTLADFVIENLIEIKTILLNLNL